MGASAIERGGFDEPRGETIARRVKTIALRVAGLVLVTALFPALLVIALALDLVRWVTRGAPWVATRLLCFLWVYLAAETVGLVALLGVWVAAGFGRRRAWMAEWTWRFQQVWAGWLFAAVRGLFGLRLEVAGEEVVTPGPVIVLIRHASIVDNLLPSVLVARRARVRLRYVLKRELLADPCLDVAGRRLPNYFVRRGTGEAVERENVRRLATGMGVEDGLLLYPEGTRFTPDRRAAALARIAERDPARAARMAGVRHLLAPKVGGLLAVLDGAPDADVVVMAHQGLDGLRLISDIWSGALVGRRIRVRFTRIPRAEVPAGVEERVRWLDDVWAEMDAWVGAVKS
jgi:1-acyl-sn-glycerol-3-phosphate acyltransferase